MDTLRKPLDGTVKSILSTRKSFHENRVFQNKPDATGRESRRLNAYAIITKEGGPTLNMTEDGFPERYNTPNYRPRDASLTGIEIRRVTAWAPKINLTLEIDVEFEVYTYDQFQRYASHYLRRDAKGTPITITWGHVTDNGGSGKVNNVIKGARVLAGSFTNTELNIYKCSFTAIAPASALLGVDIYSMKDIVDVFPGQFFLHERALNKPKRVAVTNLITKILHDLQHQGNSIIRLTPQHTNGYTPVPDTSGLPSVIGPPTPPHSGKVFDKIKGSNVRRSFFRWASKEERDGVESQTLDYVSLEYLVWLLNQTVIRSAIEKSGNVYSNFAIYFDEIPKSYVDSVSFGSKFKSADPINVLFLGAGSGNYQFGGVEGGVDFEVGGTYFNKCVSNGTVDHRYILINRKRVIQALTRTIQDKDTEHRKKREDAVADERRDDKILLLKDFYDEIFEVIHKASGGYVNLSLSHYEPEGSSVEDKERLKIVDMYAVSKKTEPPWRFNPIEGDGSTLNLTVEGKLPNDLTTLALVAGMGEGSNTNAKAAEDNVSFAEQLINLLDRIRNPSHLGKRPGIFPVMVDSDFSEASIQEACTVLSSYRKYASKSKIFQISGGISFTEYFDVTMNITIEGLYPIIAGNLFTSTNLPSFLKTSNDLAFVALDVKDKIEAPGIWTTEISTRLTPYIK